MIDLYLGFTAILTVKSLGFAFLGVLIGMLIGVLPGIGPATAMSILFPMTYYADASQSIILLAAIYYGSQYGDNISAITMRIAHSSSIVICQDGYDMAKQGNAGKALYLSTLATFAAGIITILLVASFTKPIASLMLVFGSPEYAMILLFGITCACLTTTGSLSKNVAAFGLGLFLGLIGIDIDTGASRFTFGVDYLLDGIPLTLFVTGIFGLGEIVYQALTPAAKSYFPQSLPRLTYVEAKQVAPSILRGISIGSIIGLLPGGGSVWASFASHSVEKKLSDSSENAVAGPSAASEAAANTGLIPLLSLGIPENAAMAIMFSALIVHGFTPGPELIIKTPQLLWELIASMIIGNACLLLLNIPGIKLWIKILNVPKYLSLIVVTGLCLFGAFIVRNNSIDIIVCIALGGVGLLFRYFHFPVLLASIGFILGPMFLERFNKSMLISNGSLNIFLERPITLTLVIVTALMVIYYLASKLRKKYATV